MQKTTTPKQKADFSNQTINKQGLNPKTSTLKTIMQFASAYRSEVVIKNRQVDIILN